MCLVCRISVCDRLLERICSANCLCPHLGSYLTSIYPAPKMCKGLFALASHILLPTGCEGEDEPYFTDKGNQGGEGADGMHKAP